MITKNNFKKVLEKLNFIEKDNIYKKHFKEFDCELKVDFKNEKFIYPEDKGLIVNDSTTSNFSSPENFVVFECVNRLLVQGYNPAHIELEKKWQLGHTQKSGKADIYIKDNDGNSLIIIECKTAGKEYKKAINILENDSRNQLFSYLQQATSTKFLALYTSDFVDDKIVDEYYLIRVVDNEELLKNTGKIGYKDASTAEEKWEVWQNSYEKEYATIGLFEDNKPYEIGKTKFKLSDLRTITSKDISRKYNDFATILRKYNVSGRENAFDKLVNLFLCKVVDEIKNPDELKFYYKGVAYDNPFDFQDRLQQLYKDGMKEFIGEDITYIDNNQIEDAFSEYDLKVIKDKIKQFLKEQKFFTNNDFAFIDVHNEKLFYQNFKVLLDVVRLIQDITLTKSENNQFLGDMFEGFLDQGIKQSEGQFFTPLPIVKFIINSLPKKDRPKAIDYACGAGHFCNEFARVSPKSEIVGIEKEYRLSKVAKVSSFMYGNDVKIIYNDALKQDIEVKKSYFDVLIANPPYSVKGFLETLDEASKNSYELIKYVDSKSYSKTNAIECFFIERTKQLLKKDGVAGIIVPSSILNKDTPKLYTATREILLKYFDIVAIAEFGSGTFGKTGTNTVTLFLKRRDDVKNIANVYQELSQKLYDNLDLDILQAYEYKELLDEYVKHIEVDKKLYKTIFSEIDEKLFEIEIFKEYKESFEKLPQTKERKKKKYYKEYSKDKQKKIEKEKLLKYIREIEKEKFYYFCLAYKNQSDVVIVKSPTKNSEIKNFLGYEWSGRKGSEGIQYITEKKITIDEEIEDEDKRVLENLAGIENIKSPLYNPKNRNDNTKINKIIKDNFNGIKTAIPDELKKYVSRASLVDMLDFNRVEFNKALNLNPTKKVEIKSRWELVKLIDISKDIIAGGDKPKVFSISKTEQLNIPIFSNSISKKGLYGYTNEARVFEPSVTITARGTIGVAFARNKPFYPIVRLIVITPKKELANIFYLEIILNFIDFDFNGAGVSQLPVPIVENTKIPLPPLKIQEKIVQECEAIDKESEELKVKNEELEKEIKKLFEDIYNQADKTIRLSDENNFDVFIGKRVLSKDISQNKDNGIPVYSANVYEPFGYTKNEFLKDFSLDSVLWGIDGDWMVNIIEKNKPFYPTDHCGVIRVKSNIIEPNYLRFALEKVGKEQRFSRQNRASTARIKALNIKYPDISLQNKFSKFYKEAIKQIKKNNIIINKAKTKKEEVLRNYL